MSAILEKPISKPSIVITLNARSSSSATTKRFDRRRSTILPFVKASAQPLRASFPDYAGTALEGGAPRYKRSMFRANYEDEIYGKSAPCSRWIYHAMLILLMSVVIGLCIGSVTLELFAFLGDTEWNKILAGSVPFRSKAVSHDSIFGGKKLSKVIQIFPPSMKRANLQKYLHRDQALEIGFLTLMFLVIVCAIITFLIYVGSSVEKWRKRLITAYLGFGLLGVVLFLCTILLALSTLVYIPHGVIRLRAELEDEVGNDLLKNATHEMHPVHQKYHLVEKVGNKTKYHVQHRGWPFPLDNCDIVKGVEHAKELQRLLDIVKICVYSRYITMNFKDPCKNKRIPDRVAVDPDKKNYTVNDLEKLNICPMDRSKIIAISLALGASICSWCVMWLGSYAFKVLFPYDTVHDSLLYQPGAVYAMEDLSGRSDTDVPAEMRIVSPKMWHSSTSEPPLASPSSSAIVTAKDAIRVKMAAVNRFKPGGRITRDLSPDGGGLREMMSIMNIAPRMVIRPPRGGGVTPGRTSTIPTPVVGGGARTSTTTPAATAAAAGGQQPHPPPDPNLLSTWFHTEERDNND